MLHPQLRQKEWGGGRVLFACSEKLPSHKGTQAIPIFSQKRKSPFYFPAQTPPKTSFPLALETSFTFRLAKNYQIHHKELWGLPDSQLWPPTPISESYLAGRGILFLDKQQSGAPVPWLPGQPITAACMLPSSPGDGAQRLLSGSGKDLAV